MPAYDETESKKFELEPGEVQMSYSIYNKIFGTMYSSTNYDLSVNNTFTLKLYNYVDGEKIVVYSKDFKIVGISTSTFFDVEDFAEIISYNKVDYSLYIENTEKTKDMISYGNEHSFYLKTSDFESGLVINKLTSTFNTLFTIILICIYVVFGSYIIIYGVNTVKSNKEEIGIYKALGGKFRNIAKVLFIDVILTGVVISILSLFFTPFIISICDNIIVESFKNVLHLGAVNIEIIKIYPGILALNYSLLNSLILTSAIVPTILLIRLKPIEIIKN
jgi:ABC-type lipoprotein release transport system permease subunit